MSDEREPRIGRRALLEWAAASAALAGCARAPVRKIVPYVVQPPEVVPGRPLHYATAWELDGYGMGLVALTNSGRPTKLEGNPKHPASLGASRAVDQALLETLYDPDRAKGVANASGPASMQEFVELVGHRRVAVLMPPTSSRSIETLVARLRAENAGSDVWFYTPLARANVWAAGKAAFGAAIEPSLDASKTRGIVSFASDFMASGPSCVRVGRALANKRAADGSRLWSLESHRTPTGVFADERRATSANDRARFACAIAARVFEAADDGAARGLASTLRDRAGDVDSKFADACAHDLAGKRGAAAWVVGDGEPMELHALAWLVNRALGAVGGPIVAMPSPVLEAGERSHDLRDFGARVASGGFDLVVLVGVNPVYSAPSLDLARSLAGAKETAYVGLHQNETSAACHWFVPEAHPLESWGDVRADDGTRSIVQPLIEPIFGGLGIAEVLGLLLGDLAPNGHDIAQRALALDEGAWNDALQSGVVPNTANARIASSMNEDALVRAVQSWVLPAKRAIEIELHPSHAMLDGRFATPVLLELPEPVIKSTWGNVALVSHTTADALGVQDEDVLAVTAGDRTIALPAFVDRGQPDGVVSIALGWGRQGEERLAKGVGENAFELEDGIAKNAPVTVVAAGRTEPIARTQINVGLFGRQHEIARTRLRAEKPLPGDVKPRLSLYDPQLSPTAEHAWAMSIDLSRCTGCEACVAACSIENNVPVVGKAGVLNDRYMHWIRIDHYESDHGAIFQPMLCQHCDDAPCEYVCPVNATVHSPDGLNEMVYNRCVGTRFCSNNCPYKVRHFNWFNYHEDEPALRQLQHNPQVTVRARGVMEKCSFCVQRIRDAEHVADSDHRALRRDEVVTACQQTCPTQAIVFGDKNDANSAVSLRYGLPEAYAVLDELGTRPRIRYLPKIVDKSPERT